MEEPFDINLGRIVYSVFPEEDGVYAIFKEGIEYMKIQRDTEQVWLRLDPETDLPLFGEDEEVNRIGMEIQRQNAG
jgi:hypothetical protein